ncbi:MAG: nucleotidyltransferase family protein [Clostridia bacterium]|nr:nucleotidyltransferase family protein [Clostridia bacterium]
MHTAAVICEFDPLHRGHRHLLDEARRAGAERIVCVMSGDFTQRGEPAALSSHTRAEMALAAGADLVLELPFPYSCGSAEFFAHGAMSVIAGLGGVDTLVFGCESGDARALCEAAARTMSAEFANEYENMSKEHTSLGTAAVVESVYARLYSSTEIFRGANNVLAIEYIKAAHRLGLSLSYHAVSRRGAGHGEMREVEGYVSASFLRKKMHGSPREIEAYLPAECREAAMRELSAMRSPARLENIESAILCHYRLGQADGGTAESAGGLGRRLERAALCSDDYASLIENAKTKKYTDARLRRAIVYSLCGVQESDLKANVSYTTLLGAGERGRALLGERKKTRTLAIVSSPRELSGLSGEACRARTLRERAAHLRALCTDSRKPTAPSTMLRAVIVK